MSKYRGRRRRFILIIYFVMKPTHRRALYRYRAVHLVVIDVFAMAAVFDILYTMWIGRTT